MWLIHPLIWLDATKLRNHTHTHTAITTIDSRDYYDSPNEVCILLSTILHHCGKDEYNWYVCG